MSRTRSTRLLTGLAAAGAVLAGCGGSEGEERRLQPIRPDTMFRLADFEPGKPTEFTFAAIYIDAPGKTVEILEVSPVATPNVEYIGAIAVWPNEAKGNTSDGGPGFPTKTIKKYHQALGQTIPPEATGYRYPGETKPRSIVVNAGFRLTGTGSGAVNSVEVVYRVDGELKREQSRAGVIACVAPCPDEAKYNDDPDEWQRLLLAKYGLTQQD